MKRIFLFALIVVALPQAAMAEWKNWIEENGLRYARRIDLGQVQTGGPVGTAAFIENISDAPIYISDLSPTCGCTVLEWTPRDLAPGESVEPQIELEGYDHGGHFRHLVTVLGHGDAPLGNLVVTADAVVPVEDVARLRVPLSRADLGAYTPGVAAQVDLPLHNESDEPVLVEVSASGAVEVPAGIEVKLKPRERRTVRVPVTAGADIWGAKLRVRAGEESRSIPVLGYAVTASNPSTVRVGPLEIEGLRRVGDNVLVDVGQLALGETRLVELLLRNAGSSGVQVARLFTSSEDDLRLGGKNAWLEPGAETRISVQVRGRQRPGSFRRFFHVFLGGTEPSQHRIGVVGRVQSPREIAVSNEIVAFQVRWDANTVSLLDQSGTSIGNVPTLDHAAYALTAGEITDALCANCSFGPSPLPAVRRTLKHAGQSIDVISVLGDEQFGAKGQYVQKWLDDPNNTIITLLHPEGFDEDHPSAVNVAVFHDAEPLVEEAARRTRMPAVFVVAGSTSAVAKVESVRDVLVFTPGLEEPGTLWVFAKDSQILHWELRTRDES